MYKSGDSDAAGRLAKCNVRVIDTNKEHLRHLNGCTMANLEAILDRVKAPYDLRTISSAKAPYTVLVVSAGKRVQFSVDELNNAARALGCPVKFEEYNKDMGFAVIKPA